jgi:hypothetical protein
MKEVEYGLPKPDRNPPVHATRTNPPPPAENVSQFHCLAKNHQAPFGGAHGRLQRSKSFAFDMSPRPTKARVFRAITFTGTPSCAPPVLLIDVPSKIWRPKRENTWRMPTYADDIDEDLLVFKEHGVGLARTMKTRDLPPRDDVEFWDVKYQAELDAELNIGTSCPEHIRDRVIGVVKKYWDNFFATGSSRPIRGYEFAIDTGDAKPVCCRLPNYGPHESNIINKQLMALRINWWIKILLGTMGIHDCVGPEATPRTRDEYRGIYLAHVCLIPPPEPCHQAFYFSNYTLRRCN